MRINIIHIARSFILHYNYQHQLSSLMITQRLDTVGWSASPSTTSTPHLLRFELVLIIVASTSLVFILNSQEIATHDDSKPINRKVSYCCHSIMYFLVRQSLVVDEDISFHLIRNYQPINVYVPSKRMRKLLTEWLYGK